MEQGLAASCADPFELAGEYLDLMRRARDGKPPITVTDLERRGELRSFLEKLVAKGEAGDDGQARRRYLRVPTLQNVEFSDGEKSTSGWLIEIAEGGVFVATEAPFAIGTGVRIEIVVDDAQAEGVAQAIVKSANTGKIGDGKVFLSNVEEAIRIRTGETGSSAVAVN